MGLALAISLTTLVFAASLPVRVGGPPPFPVDELIPGFRSPEPAGPSLPKRSGPEILLGVGHRAQLEIVGYRAGKSACVFTANRQLRSSSGGCGKVAELPPEGHAIVIEGTSGTPIGPPGDRLSGIEGTLRPDVAEVRLRYRVHGSPRHSRAVVAPGPRPQRQTHGHAQPFGRFAATFHGCSSWAVVTALGDSGEVLESTTIAADLLHLRVPCKGSGGSLGSVAVE